MNFLSDNTAIVTLLLLTLLVLLLLGVVIWAAMKGAQAADRPAAQQPRLISADTLKQSFKVAVELIENNLAARSERYNLNWTLILNEGAPGRQLPLAQSGLQSALSADSTLTAGGQGISWNFFDKGVVVQLQSGYLGSPDPDAPDHNKTWDDFLGLCSNYRQDRPFDGIVLAIPAAAFIHGDGEGQMELLARAKAIHRRLWLAQNRLALRFPIYIMLSDCETIPGFARFASALPEALRRSMLGWSSPYELTAPFQSNWVDSAMNEIVRSVSDSCAELCALEPAGSDSSDYFLLPSQIERVRTGLKVFVEELMRPSAYHEPFLLRGMYLTGDCSDAAALLSDNPDADPLALDAPGSATAGTALAPAEEFAEPGVPALHVGQGSSAVPAFLRDVFERKVFAESGLVRASSVNRMRRPAMSRVVRWCAIGVPAVWVIGLVFATVRLHNLTGPVVSYLHQLDQDTRASLQAANNNVIDPAISRRRAMEALQNIEQMGAARLGSFFMPGSWSWFDSLHQRVQMRLEKGFADNAFDPLRRAAYTQVSNLTGVPVEPVSGSLVVGGRCTLPANWAQAASVGNTALNMEDLPEFSATSQYVARVEQMEKVLQAIMRLKSPASGPASGDDLALVVRHLLGAELNGNSARTAGLFRQVAQSVPSLTMDPLHDAAACSLKLAVKATTKRLYANNGLLLAERAIGDNAAAIQANDARTADPAAILALWQNLRAALKAQEAYMAPGKGAWMRRNAMELGPAWDNLLQKVQTLALLGKAAADDARKQADDGFTEFLSAWDGALAADSLAGGMNAGVEWSDANGGWAMSPDRKTLLEALNTLLSQPYMKFNGARRLPDVPVEATVGWDRAHLDQVLALADARKRFQTEQMNKFPAALQNAASGLSDAGLVATARDLLSQAFYVSAREVQAPSDDGDRSRAMRVRAWLIDMGAPGAADELASVLVKDALSRLQLLDETFARAQVFVPRDRTFLSWVGGKAPLIDAFGAIDAGGLNAYVSQQQSFIDAIGKDAESLLLQLGSGHSSNPLVARWQATVADLNRYRLKSPTSSLMALEQFVTIGAADLELGNCLDKLSARAAQRRGSDIFSERMQLLQAGLYSRCRDLTLNVYQDSWTRFADAFNRDLANRSPFRTLALDTGVRGVQAEHIPAADVDEVGTVLKLFDRAHALTVASDRDPSRPAPASNLRKVDDQMQKVRDFLAPLYPADEGQAAGLDVMVEFRANAAAESEGNKIIDWAMMIGGQTLHQRDPQRPLRWEPGMPVVLSLRFAQDGLVVPKPEAGRAGMSVEDRTVSYRFDDPWSLFSLVSAYREPEGATSNAARSQLLRFDFPVTGTGGDGKVATRDGRAKVFVRLTVSAAGKRAPLVWPGAFPAKVPAW
ncbi:hypothetical protein GM668_16840 [Duganella ginsengisoli]|uniref:Type VI secretion system component TssM1 N-terminal domain-containing protein n=1 Tax=Pseudoduganella ginsengisoli TaxID=1462440 RepID=A0A6L6Q383_9BURK|nr:type VI secretion system protein [Pseudoduganella ginsengisoli]MTW03751.1 hypothetical protein [Pseudoduganella ginsengisoli]